VPAHLKAEILREIDRLELVLHQISEVEAERDEMLRPAQASSPAALLMRLKGIGAEFAAVLYLEGLFRRSENRRQLAAYAGLAPSPWNSYPSHRRVEIVRERQPARAILPATSAASPGS
jgi:transposase